jgi:hypothetical protein
VTELVVGHGPVARSGGERTSGAGAHTLRPTPAALGAPVSPAVERVFARALALFPAERWQTVGAFWEALDTAIAGRRRSSVAAPEVRTHRARAASKKRSRAGLAALGVIALALGAVTASDVVVNRTSSRAARARPPSATASAPRPDNLEHARVP